MPKRVLPREDESLPLAALLIATDIAGPRVLGSDNIALQIRRARAAGIEHAVIYAERVTADVIASVDQLRAEGLSVDLARSVGDAAEMIHPDEAVLLLATDIIATSERLAIVAAHDAPVLLCVRDEPTNERFERIDATARWTGLARVDGGLIRRTAALVGDWDFAATLMRRAVQEGTARLMLTPEEADAELMAIDSPAAAQITSRRLIVASPIEHAGWGMRWLIAPLARLLARAAADLGVQTTGVMLAGFALNGVAIACALAGWVAASCLFLLAGSTLDIAGGLAAQAGSGALRWEKYRQPLRATTAVIVGLAIGTTLTLRTGQWGCIILALVLVVATWLAAGVARDDRRLAALRGDPGGHAVIGVVGFLVGAPVVALAVAAAHAALSLAVAVRTALARP